MDSDLRHAEKKFLTDMGDAISGQAYRNALSRAGKNPTEIYASLAQIFAREVKGLLLDNILLVLGQFPTLQFINFKPELQVFASYKGHLVDAPGIYLTGSDSWIAVILTPDGIFRFEQEHCNLKLIDNKIHENQDYQHQSPGRYPKLASQKEEVAHYVTHGAEALNRLTTLLAQLNKKT